jgi:hypothetical protein
MTVTINGAGTITGLTSADVPQVNVTTKLLVGGPTTSAGAQGVQVYGLASAGAANILQRAYSDTTNGAQLLMLKTRGTTATSTTAVQSGDTLGAVTFLGADGTSNQAFAAVTGYVDGAVSTGTVPTAISFTTGTTVGTTRMTIGSSGKVDMYNAVKVIGNSSPPAGGTTGLGLEFTNATNLGIFVGSGVPTLSAAQGSLYMRTDGSSTSTRMYINTNGSTTWTSVTTAA